MRKVPLRITMLGMLQKEYPSPSCTGSRHTFLEGSQGSMSQEQEGNSGADTTVVNKNKKYRKPKPWDTDDIDHWKEEPFEAGQMKSHLLEESSFATLFPKYREKYLKEVWPVVTRTLDAFSVVCVLDLIEGSMTVKTTRKTWDPYIIMKARDLIKLLARGVSIDQAKKVMEDDCHCEVIKIGSMVRNKERFVKRRQRLVGPNGATQKALEILTESYILVQGNTVCVMGRHAGLKVARRVILDCMKNIHPVYHIKELMIKRELMKDETLKAEDWSRFLPSFQKKNVQRKKKKSKKNPKEYQPFPPEQKPRDVDLQLESGEYFISAAQKHHSAMSEKKRKSEAVSAERRQEKMQVYVAPVEEDGQKMMKSKKQKVVEDSAEDVAARLKDKLHKKKSKRSE